MLICNVKGEESEKYDFQIYRLSVHYLKYKSSYTLYYYSEQSLTFPVKFMNSIIFYYNNCNIFSHLI